MGVNIFQLSFVTTDVLLLKKHEYAHLKSKAEDPQQNYGFLINRIISITIETQEESDLLLQFQNIHGESHERGFDLTCPFKIKRYHVILIEVPLYNFLILEIIHCVLNFKFIHK